MSDHEYNIESTSAVTWTVEDQVLRESDLTRKVLRTQLVKNAKDPRNSVKLCLVHQKRSKASDEWIDLDSPTLKQTKPLAPSKFQIDSEETYKVFNALADLYEVDPSRVGHGKVKLRLADASKVIETDSSRAELIRQILDADHGTEVWELLVRLQPDLVTKLNALRRLEARKQDLDRFEAELDKNHPEERWRKFIKNRPWLLGSTYVKMLDEQKVDIKNETDIPLQVDGMFMDIVELKRPDAQFWRLKGGKPYKYRDKFLVPHWEVDAAIAQVSGYILQAEKHLDSKDFQEMHQATPLRPRGIVVYGRSYDWGDDEWKALRLVNSRLHGVEIITFDQVLAQGRRLLELYEADLPEAVAAFSVTDSK